MNLGLEPVSSPIIPPVSLNIYESGNQVFSVLLFFLIMWNPLDIICNHFVFSGSYPLISLEGCQLTSIQVFKKTRLIFLRVFDIFLVVKFGCKEMSDLPKGKNNYEVKIWIKKHDLPKARVSDKTINFNFLKVSKITKINYLELSKVINRN